jgi:hypothetical protein
LPAPSLPARRVRTSARNDGRQVGGADNRQIDAAGEHRDHDGKGQDAELRKLHRHRLHIAHSEELARQQVAEGRKNQDGDDQASATSRCPTADG